MLFTKNKIKKISLLSVLIFLIIFSVQAFAMPDMVSVNVPDTRQIKSYWCWCATGVALLSSKDIPVTQNSFSIAVKGNSTNNEGGDPTEIKLGLSSFGYNATKTGIMSSSSVRDTLNSGKAIIAGYHYIYYGGGHYVVISGHKKSNDTLEVMDPGVGRKEYYNFDYFVSNSDWEWDVSLY
ncbi:C39 family peptidase [Clostridiaceae bacterium M8S5]|nr:C39 family peptidase [Clostridiaceae bacterium M8S5]